MKTKSGHSEFLSAIRTTAAARTLVGVYQRLAGELDKALAGESVFIPPADAKAAMAHVLATLEFLGVKVDRRKLKARRTRPQIGLLNYGGIRRGILMRIPAKLTGHSAGT